MTSDLLIHNAEEKMKAGMKSNNPTAPETLIQGHVMEALLDFCRQDKRIAEAIIQSDRPFSECCKYILNDTKSDRYISDFKAYERAVKFYVPDAEIEYSMTVKMNGGDTAKISLLDLLD